MDARACDDIADGLMGLHLCLDPTAFGPSVTNTNPDESQQEAHAHQTEIIQRIPRMDCPTPRLPSVDPPGHLPFRRSSP
jgi:hypothetical protein